MDNKLNVKQSTKDGQIRNNQRGALLIGLIITMVIISALSGAMVYIFSSSTLNPVSGKYAQQAYYNAEAGFRYLTSEYRNAATPDEGKTAINKYALAVQTLNMPEGGTAKVIMTAPSVKVTATANVVSGIDDSVVIDAGYTGTFSKAPGYFSKEDTGATVYRYLGMNTANPGIGEALTLTRITPPITTGGKIETKEQVTITSIGNFGSGLGLWNTNRKVSYAWVLSGFPPGSPPDYGAGNQDLLQLPDMVAPYKLSEDPQGRFEVVPDVPNPNTAVLQGNVDGDLGISINLASGYEYLFININWWNFDDMLNINNAYQSQGRTLSYDMQLKQYEVVVGKMINNFLVGLSARVESNDMLNNHFYGMSLFYSKSEQKAADIPIWLKSTTQNSGATLLSGLAKDTYFLIFWKMDHNVKTVIGHTPVESIIASPTGATDRRADWPTIFFRIQETGSGTEKSNTIKALVYSKTQKPRGTLNWPTETDWASPFYTVTDISNTTIDSEKNDLTVIPSDPNGRPEIGLHVFADSGADNKIYLDDFAVKMEAAGGALTYQPPVQQ